MIIRQRVIPIVILFGLLPRSFCYLLRVDEYPLSILLFVILLCLSITYIVYRFIYVNKMKPTKKRFILNMLDTFILIIGILAACYFSGKSLDNNHLIFAWTAVPFYLNNYLISHYDI